MTPPNHEEGSLISPQDAEEADTTSSGQDTVQAMHDIFMREQAEPHDGFEPVPFIVIAIFGALLMWGGYYAGSSSADFRGDIFDGSEIRFEPLQLPKAASIPDPDPKTVTELMKIGEQRYRSICMACHKPDGLGDPSQQYPPLDGSEWVAGSEASPSRLSRIVLYGLQQPITVKGRSFNGQMPAQGATLKDYEIASVLTYVRNSWGNRLDKDDARPTITPALIRAVRDKVGKHEPMTVQDLLKLAADYTDLPPGKKDGG